MAGLGGSTRVPSGQTQAWRWAAGGIIALGAVLMVIGQASIRLLEAQISALVISVTQVAQAHAIGSSVVFPLREAFVGFTVTVGCTAALLVIPFFLLAGGLIVSGRTTVERGITTLAVLIVSLFAVNQVRLLIIALSMRVFGFQRGFDLSHVLLGTVVSTLGVLAGLLLYLRTALHTRPAAELRE